MGLEAILYFAAIVLLCLWGTRNQQAVLLGGWVLLLAALLLEF